MELFCCETENIIRAQIDPVILDDPRVVMRLLDTESHYLITENYFGSVQDEVTPDMRRICLTWLLEVADNEKCEDAVFPLAANYMDRYLASVRTAKNNLQLLACVCLMLATKLRQSKPLSSGLLAAYTDYTYSTLDIVLWSMVKIACLPTLIHQSVLVQEEISLLGFINSAVKLKVSDIIYYHHLRKLRQTTKKWETDVLHILKWKLAAVTPHDYVDTILFRLPEFQRVKHLVQSHARTFQQLIALEFEFSSWPSSLIALSTIGAAVRGLPNIETVWPPVKNLSELFNEMTDIEISTIDNCIEYVEAFVNKCINNAQRTQEENSGAALARKRNGDYPSDDNPDTPPDVTDVKF